MCVIGIRSARCLSIVGCWGSNTYQVDCHIILDSICVYALRSIQKDTITLAHPFFKSGFALVTTQGNIPIRERLENWILPGSVRVKHTGRCSATTCDAFTWLSSQYNFSQAFEFSDFKKGPNYELISRYLVWPFNHAVTIVSI